MKALCWHGTNDIRCDSVPDPKIEDGRDVVIKVTSCAICGSDLHLMDGLMPTMKSGDILGHEFMGEVVEVGSAHLSHPLILNESEGLGEEAVFAE
jgi:threonine dehydrogenase-like Zn-dependent dehydrogenase